MESQGQYGWVDSLLSSQFQGWLWQINTFSGSTTILTVLSRGKLCEGVIVKDFFILLLFLGRTFFTFWVRAPLQFLSTAVFCHSSVSSKPYQLRSHGPRLKWLCRGQAMWHWPGADKRTRPTRAKKNSRVLFDLRLLAAETFLTAHRSKRWIKTVHFTFSSLTNPEL